MNWLEDRNAWIGEGVTRGFVTSKVRCATHERICEEGIDDPCIPIVRLAKEPGEAFIEGP